MTPRVLAAVSGEQVVSGGVYCRRSAADTDVCLEMEYKQLLSRPCSLYIVTSTRRGGTQARLLYPSRTLNMDTIRFKMPSEPPLMAGQACKARMAQQPRSTLLDSLEITTGYARLRQWPL
ncbi:hypothetical protein J6590_005532 [Homalodisca vitripennis]|nr:hypothetical protein J6590_005532 [Homalodisca vitripennis]